MTPTLLTDEQRRVLQYIADGHSVNDDLGRGSQCIELGSESTGIRYTVGDELARLGLITLEYENEDSGWVSYRVYRATEAGKALLEQQNAD